MTGRQTHILEIKQKIDAMLDGRPAYLRSFYNSMVNSGKTASYQTIWKYLQHTLRMIDTIGKPVESVTYDDMVNYLAEVSQKGNGESKSGSYMIAVYSALKKFFSYMENSERIKKSPMAKIDRPAPKPSDQVKRVYLTKADLKLVFDEVRRNGGKFAKRDELILALFLTTGMRCTALTEIDLNDIDFSAKTVRIIEKRNKQRVFTVSDDVIRLMRAWIADRETWGVSEADKNALFVSAQGARMSSLLVSNAVEHYCKVTGKHITPHKLRGTCATLLSDSGMSVYEIQLMLGHSSPKTTEIYLQNKEAKIRMASETASSFYIA